MGSIDSRLKRLEESGQGGDCPECGFPPDGPGYIVYKDEEDPKRSFQGDRDERCKRCGRRLYFVIEVARSSPAREEGGGGYRWP